MLVAAICAIGKRIVNVFLTISLVGVASVACLGELYNLYYGRTNELINKYRETVHKYFSKSK